MMKSRLLIYITILLAPGRITSYAQEDTVSASTHFILPQFIKGSVSLKNGRTEEALLNYNMISEEMIFERDNKRLALENIKDIDTVYLDSKKFIPHENFFYEVLIKDTVSLFARHKLNVLQAGSPAGYGGTTETGAAYSISHLAGAGYLYKLHLPSEYHLTDASQYLITFRNSSFKVTSERQVLKLFPDISSKLKQYIVENKLNIRKQEDLVSLLKKCNELKR